MTNQSIDEDLNRWAEDFRNEPGSKPNLSLETLMTQAKKDRRAELLKMVRTVLALLLAVAVFVDIVVTSRSVVVTIFSAVVLPVLMAQVGHRFYVRSQVGRVEAGKVDNYVRLNVRRRIADLKIARMNRIFFGVLVSAFWIWLPFFVLQNAASFANAPITLAVKLVLVLAVFVGTWFWTNHVCRKAERECAHWMAVSRSVESADGE
jgi:hypothetical protein